MTTISASEAKTHFGALIDKAQQEHITIEKKGRPVAVVLSFTEYQERFATTPTSEDKAEALAFLSKWGQKPAVEPKQEALEGDLKAQAIWDKYSRS